MTNHNFPHKICLIYGNQQLLVEETTNNLIDERLDDREREWSLERFNTQEILKSSTNTSRNTIDDFLISCETLPMLTDRKVIQLDNFELIKKAVKTNDSTPLSKLFIAINQIINNPPEHLWFVFTSSAMREQDLSKPLLRSIKQSGRIHKFVAYDDSSPFNWVVQRGKKKGVPLSADAARLMINIVGNDLTDLDHELEKLSLYFLGKPITEDLIKEHVRGHKHFSVFRMTEALSHKELLTALEILDQQLQTTPREHVRLFALIIMQFRRLLIIHCMLSQSYKESEILAKISLPPFLAKKVLGQAKNFSNLEIQNIYAELAKLDLRVKFKSSLAPILLQDLFQRICNGQFKTVA